MCPGIGDLLNLGLDHPPFVVVGDFKLLALAIRHLLAHVVHHLLHLRRVESATATATAGAAKTTTTATTARAAKTAWSAGTAAGLPKSSSYAPAQDEQGSTHRQ